jgi:hypothetical protein
MTKKQLMTNRKLSLGGAKARVGLLVMGREVFLANLVPEAGLEPALLSKTDFESVASAISPLGQGLTSVAGEPAVRYAFSKTQ